MAINVNKTRYTFLSFISLFTGSPSSFAQSLTRMIHKSFVRDPVSKEREHCSSCSPPILYTTSSTTTSSRLLSKDSSVRYYPDRIPKEKFGEREKLSREKNSRQTRFGKNGFPSPSFTVEISLFASALLSPLYARPDDYAARLGNNRVSKRKTPRPMLLRRGTSLLSSASSAQWSVKKCGGKKGEKKKKRKNVCIVPSRG